ncbi:MAG: 3-oxoacyl-ACP synthase III [Pseudomonadota bacterium]
MNGNAAIEAVAYELPLHRISSEFIEDQVSDTMIRLRIPPGQLAGLTGIRERRFWPPGVMPSDVATRVARKAMETAAIDPKEIGCLINTSVCKDYVEPSVAALVHGNLGLSPTCLNFDISNACLGFITGMNNIMMMIETGMIRYGIVVAGEGSREPIEATIRRLQSPETTVRDFFNNFATLTLGSGAAAILLCHKDVSKTKHTINKAVSLAATEHCRLCLGQKDQMIADAASVMVHGVELAWQTWKLAEKTIQNWSDKTIRHYIPHQVSARNMEALTKKLGLTAEKAHLNFQTLGNIGPAAIPITLGIAEEEKRLITGDHIALMGIGSGLNCTMMSVTW